MKRDGFLPEAFFRRAAAREALGDYLGAEEDLRTAAKRWGFRRCPGGGACQVWCPGLRGLQVVTDL